MNNNDLLTLLVAFVLGYFAHQMMGNMCRGRLLEGGEANPWEESQGAGPKTTYDRWIDCVTNAYRNELSEDDTVAKCNPIREEWTGAYTTHCGSCGDCPRTSCANA